MENCLVTKLKSSVNNDRLVKMNELIYYPHENQQFRLFAYSDNSKVVVTCNGCTLRYLNKTNPEASIFYVGASFMTGAGGYVAENVTQNASIHLSNKYNLCRLELSEIGPENSSIQSFSDIKYTCDKIIHLNSNYSSFVWNLEDVFTTFINAVSIGIYGTKFYGDLKDVLNKTAPLRPNTHIEGVNVNKNGNITNIPKGIGEAYNYRGDIYFTSNTEKYPNGWYIKAYDGSYWDSNGNETTGE